MKLVRDATNAHGSIEAIADSEQRLRMLIDSAGDTAIFSVDPGGAIRSWNAGAETIFGYARADVIGRPLSTLYSADDVVAGYPAQELAKATLAGTISVERWLRRKDGSRFLAGGKISGLKRAPNHESRGFAIVLHDVTAQHAVAEDFRRRAQFDELTDLANRRTFNEHLHRAIGLMRRRSATVFAVLFIDVDHFKEVNDRYGHIVADGLLAATARRLEQCVRSGDIVARIGGDEFAILLNAISDLKDATDAAERISSKMSEHVTIEGADLFATVSVGIAMGSPNYERPEDILRDADAAMYAAKLDGRGRAAVFDPRLREHGGLADTLAAAIERNELRLAFQPIVALSSSEVVGFEALVRWAHPQRGLLLPDAFIPQIERSEAIFSLDRWILTESCRQLVAWQENGLDRALTISVNVSGREFSHGDFPADLDQIVKSTGIAAANLRIEVTENAIIERSARAAGMVAAVRELGVRVDVDDFGTGFSSLATLQHTEVDALKIDASFVASIGERVGGALVEMVIGLARKLELDVIAEGIETTDQAERLRRLGCTSGQGRFFAPPLGAEQAGEFAFQR